ncbi:sodium/hydrogen exchanger family protein [Trichoderma parareesei]|uniref:Sodium/hydrogen exchanger family protein n=1 Tax=Trichoderma parareesei TaxID=858221 RepID=A0A2H2ZIC8_TRIPA|nr:sodium/hydrogen exchanger family protein [Trichoderma parareesei]
MADIWAVPLALTDFNIVVSVLGGFVSLFGLVSYLLKENYYLSEALISLLIGVAFGPHGANFIRPDAYTGCSGVTDVACTESRLAGITLNFSRLVLGVQLVIAGVQLPSKYLWREHKSLLLLLGPGMVGMWLATSLLVWAFAGTHSFLHALAVGACVTPTDPVLSAVIVKGKFADHNIPKELQNLIVAESGANDGLGYPFLFFALYLIKFVGSGATSGGAGEAMGLWFAYTWGYTIILSIIYGAVVGLLAKELLRWAVKRNYVDRESFIVSAISLALFVLGTCGLIGTDDVLACFIAGNAFTWDDWFRLETLDDSLQPTIDMLLNVSIFLWYGAYIPWTEFRHNSLIPLYKLVPLGVAVLLVRRLPWIFGLHRWIHQITGTHQALFVGFFGPIGVSAVFYLFITLEFIEKYLSDEEGNPRSDVAHLGATVRLVVWFLAVCSVVVHGLSIPLGKIGYLAPRTLSRVLTESSMSTSGDLGGPNNGSTFSTIARWFPSGNGAGGVATERVIGPPMSTTATSEVSKPPPMPPSSDVPLDALGPGAGPREEARNAVRETQIRFHDELEPRSGTRKEGGSGSSSLRPSPSPKPSQSPRPPPSPKPSPNPK